MSKINAQRVSPLGTFHDSKNSCHIFHVKTAPTAYDTAAYFQSKVALSIYTSQV